MFPSSKKLSKKMVNNAQASISNFSLISIDIDGVYNSQNERIWTANCMEADTKDGIKRRRKYPQKVMVWLAVCS